MEIMNNGSEARASDHLHASIAIVIGIFVGIVTPYLLTVTVFNDGGNLSDFRDALFWSAFPVLSFLGVILSTWGIAKLLKERKMKHAELYTPSAVLIAAILFIVFSLISPYLILFFASLSSS